LSRHLKSDVLCVIVDVITLDKLDKSFCTVPDFSDKPRFVGVSDVIDLLVMIYDPLTDHSGSLHNVNIPLSVDLILNWLLNVYDRYDSHSRTHTHTHTHTHTQKDSDIETKCEKEDTLYIRRKVSCHLYSLCS